VFKASSYLLTYLLVFWNVSTCQLVVIGVQQKYLARQAALAEEEQEEETSETAADLDDEDDGMKAADYQELLDSINDAREQGTRLDDQTVTRLFRDRLHSKACQNQGFVLDGYPKTMEQAKELFSGTAAPNPYATVYNVLFAVALFWKSVYGKVDIGSGRP